MKRLGDWYLARPDWQRTILALACFPVATVLCVPFTLWLMGHLMRGSVDSIARGDWK